MFLFVTFSLSPYEIENLIDYLDKAHHGFVGVIDMEKELGFLR